MKLKPLKNQHSMNDAMVTEGPEQTKGSKLCTTREMINIILYPSFHASGNWRSSLLSCSTFTACNAVWKAYIVCSGQQVQIQHIITQLNITIET
jgi:hypothetical protein